MQSNASPGRQWLGTGYVVQTACLLLVFFVTGNSVLALQVQPTAKTINETINEELGESLSESWDNRLSEKLYLILSEVSSEQLLAHQPMVREPQVNGEPYSYNEIHRNVDGLVINQIRQRLDNEFKTRVSTPDNPPDSKILTIDRRRGLAVYTQAIKTKPLCYQTLYALPLLSDAEFDAMFPLIFECLGDETRYDYGMSRCSQNSVCVCEQAIAILQDKQAASHEKEFVGLLTDKQASRRVLGVQILSSHTSAFRRNGDRLLAMVHDEDAKVREVVNRNLPLLVGRVPEVITVLTAQIPSYWALSSLETIFPNCNPKEQNRIVTNLVDWMIQHPTLFSKGYNWQVIPLFRNIIPALEQSTLNNALDRLLTIFDPENPDESLLDVFSTSGAGAKQAVPALQKSLSSTTGETKVKVAKTIYQITGDASLVLPCYRAALESEDQSLQLAASSGARKLGADAAELAPLLMTLLESKYDSRYASVLRLIGPAAAETLPRLEALYEATEDYDRKRVLRLSIQAIGGESLDGK